MVHLASEKKAKMLQNTETILEDAPFKFYSFMLILKFAFHLVQDVVGLVIL